MPSAITIRKNTEADRSRLLRLAALDDSAALRGDVLLAEVGGELWAALGVDDGRAVADPFEHTAEIVELLRTMAAMERRAVAA